MSLLRILRSTGGFFIASKMPRRVASALIEYRVLVTRAVVQDQITGFRLFATTAPALRLSPPPYPVGPGVRHFLRPFGYARFDRQHLPGRVAYRLDHVAALVRHCRGQRYQFRRAFQPRQRISETLAVVNIGVAPPLVKNCTLGSNAG